MAESRQPDTAALQAGAAETRLAARAVPWILFIGVMARAIHYFANRSLWLDEAMIALNVERRSFGGLIGTLDFNQAAPLGFLWLEKLSVLVLGAGERALRLWPYLAAIAALFAFAALAKRILRPGAATCVLVGFALSAALTYYAAEVKQYAFDVAAATILLWAALRSVDRGRTGLVAAVGAIGVWLSYPLVFLLPGALAYLWLSARGREAGPGGELGGTERALIGTAVLWAGSFGAAFWLTARGASQSPLMARFWLEGFMPVPPTSGAELRWFVDAASGWIRNTLDFSETRGPARTIGIVAGGALAIAGAVRGGRTDRRLLLLVGAPIVLALMASAARVYPFEGRLILFLVPSTLILIGWGVEAGLGAARTPRAAALVCAAGWVAGAGTILVEWLAAPQREELRPVLEAVSARLQPGDRVYLHSGAQHAQLYYERTCAECSLRGADVARGRFLAGDSAAIAAEIESIGDPGRVWALFSHEWWGHGDAERDDLVAALRARSARVETLEAPGAEAYLFELRPGGSP